MDDTASTPDDDPRPSGAPELTPGVSITTVVATAATLVLDLVARFALGDQTLFWLGSAAAVVATTSALLDAYASRDAGRRALGASVLVAVLMGLSIVLRAGYADPNIGTPIRVLLVVAVATVIASAARWSSVARPD